MSLFIFLTFYSSGLYKTIEWSEWLVIESHPFTPLTVRSKPHFGISPVRLTEQILVVGHSLGSCCLSKLQHTQQVPKLAPSLMPPLTRSIDLSLAPEVLATGVFGAGVRLPTSTESLARSPNLRRTLIRFSLRLLKNAGEQTSLT